MISIFTSTDAPEQILADDRVLAMVEFSTQAAAQGDEPRHIRTPLHGPAAQFEVWRGESVAELGRHGNISYARNAELTIGQMRLADDGTDISALSARAYQELLAWLASQQHSHLWRLWNVLADINHGDGDDERYRAFCAGRHQAFSAAGYTPDQYPAASAIGGSSPELFIMFVAGPAAGLQVENPRQTHAYHYPRQYGPRSPSFARASLMPRNGSALGRLLVSGTASVVGHQSRHEHDWRAQLDETRKNLLALLHGAGAEAAPEILRLYHRDTIDPAVAIELCQQYWGAEVSILPIRGEICRRELLLEIEGVWPVPGPGAAPT